MSMSSYMCCFSMYAICIERDKVIRILGAKGREDAGEADWEIFEDILWPLRIAYEYGDPNENVMYIGEEWSEIGDNETGKQLKERVKKMVSLLSLPDKEMNFYTYTEAWYNG